MLKTRIPPPLYVLAMALTMYLADRYLPIPLPLIPTEWAWLIALAGIILVVWAGATFRHAHTTINPIMPTKASRLVTHGPFRYTRNPMYLGFTLILTGWGIWLADVPGLLGILLFALLITVLQIIPEERALRERFGEEYARYQRDVNRWFGPIRIAVPGSLSRRG